MKLFLKQRAKISFLLLMCFSLSVAIAQTQKSVKGIVLSEVGLPLPGATILEKGTNNGVVSDFDGNFSIDVTSNKAILEVSYLGYVSKEVAVTEGGEMTIRLQEDTGDLDEVVVTALGIKRSEKALGYAVQKISGGELQRVSGLDAATSLTGKIAGLLVKNSSDFGVAPVITIRGEKPLLVIDGIAYANKTLSDMSSEDIESLTVLKGPTASALYGFRGASGAILIKTKNGSSKPEGMSVNFSSNTMFASGFLAIPEKQTVYGRGNGNIYKKESTSSWGVKMDGALQSQWEPFEKKYKDYEYLPRGKDNFKNFLEQGYVTNNNVNLGYKTENTSVRSSLNWTETKGQYPNSLQDRYTYTLGGEITLSKFKLASNMAYSKRNTPNFGSNGYTSYDPMYSLLIYSAADFNILDYKNNYWLDNHWLKKNKTQNYTYGKGVNNPYFDRYEKTNEVSRDIFNADFSMSYDAKDWLKVTLRSGLDFYKDKGQLRTSKGSRLQTGNTGVPGNSSTWNGKGGKGGYNMGQAQGFSMNNDLLLTGKRVFDKFEIDYLAGGTIFYTKYENIAASTVGGLSIPAFFSLKASVDPIKVIENSKKQQVNSLYGRLALSWDKTFFLEMTGRNDWNSTLPKETRSYFYPSVSGSFIASEFLPNTKKWLDLLKIRGSWTMSKKSPKIHEINQVYKIKNNTWNNETGAVAPTTLYSSDIRPQSFVTYETGLQGVFLKNRLSFDLTYYNKNTFDILTNKAPISSASGYSKALVNTDEERSTRGWEIAINMTPVKNEDLQWDLGFNWSTFNTIYTKIDSLYTPKKLWIKAGNRVDALDSKAFVKDPKTSQLVYYNGRIKKSRYRSLFGWKNPDWIWGINSTFRYKDFSLFVSMDGVMGGLMQTRTEAYMWYTGGHPDSITEAREKDVATPGSKNHLGNGVKIESGTVKYDQVGKITEDTRVFIPNDIKTTYELAVKDLHSSSAWGYTPSSYDVYSKTFFKLREVSLTYTVPSKVLDSWWGVKAASVSFVGQNVLLWSKDFKYSDPDGGREDFSDPSVRYLGINFKLTF